MGPFSCPDKSRGQLQRFDDNLPTGQRDRTKEEPAKEPQGGARGQGGARSSPRENFPRPGNVPPAAAETERLRSGHSVHHDGRWAGED
ncbi:hypothetical protein AAFF_G00211430 [Aldrovandia affinis]|uniref:Uncharacterized protein n=1 Tax=Aldrovandia affinis TaxID=143900 RepID=A0AAD7SWI4_9TELE|nr:hypothetical protein AAFF_G00211430 [Aldrovandia affinis]